LPVGHDFKARVMLTGALETRKRLPSPSPAVWAVDNRWIYKAAVAALEWEPKEFEKGIT